MLCAVTRFKDELRRFEIPHGEISVGSSPDNDIVLAYPGISRRHLVLRRIGPDSVLLHDAGSKNGITRDGSSVVETTLRPGDAVVLGAVQFGIEECSSSDLDLQLRISASAVRRRTTPETAEQLRDDERGPVGALRIVRELESIRGPLPEQSIEKLLLSCRALLNLSFFGIIQVVDGEAVFASASGAVPGGDSLIQLVIEAAERAAKGFVRHKTLYGFRIAGGEAALLLAEVASEDRLLVEWEIDFLEYVARRLSARHEVTVTTPETATPTTGGLRLPEGMVLGSSEAIQRLLKHIESTIQSRLDVLLTGETGTGKELFARMIHASGPTAKGPFVAINCAAIPAELLEAELFGVQARVATGVDARPGLFVQADRGSIFLDEVGELAEAVQAKLLRVIQEREVLAVGASTPKKIDVRIIAATNCDLQQKTREGKFRSDLYFRLRGLQFHLPPLRDLREDIPALVIAFAERAAAKYGRHIVGVTRKALTLLLAYDWPGNIRELQNEVERAVLLCGHGSALQAEHFATIRHVVDSQARDSRAPSEGITGTPVAKQRPVTLQERIDEVEREAILEALRITGGSKTRAARLMGITRNGLAMKMRRLGITTSEE